MIVWFIVFIVNSIHGYPQGAPESACSTLRPHHSESTAQTSVPPYEIHAELNDDKVIVHILSPYGQTFKGFILQARSMKNESQFIDGEFTESQFSKAINCFGSNQNTLTHINNTPKTEIQTEWTPKENFREEVIFRATIVKQYDVFWSEINSNPLKLTNDSESVATKESMYEKCFKEESCIGLDDGCVERQNCDVLLRYSKSADDINFILQGFLEDTSYMAMAWSEDAMMGSDSVRECIRNGNDVIARDSWNEGRSNTRTTELSAILYTSSFVDGLTTCSWASPFVTEASGKTYDFINKTFYILLATGKVSEWSLKYHDKKRASPEALNLTRLNVFRNISDPGVDDSSHDTGIQQPSVSPEDKSGSTNQKAGRTTYMNETVTENHSSCLTSTCFMFLFICLTFSAKESMSYYLF